MAFCEYSSLVASDGKFNCSVIYYNANLKIKAKGMQMGGGRGEGKGGGRNKLRAANTPCKSLL